MELLVLIVIFCVAFELGKHYGYYRIVKMMKEVAAEQGIDLEKELGIIKQEEDSKSGPSVHKLEVEIHGDLLYLFDIESDKFICQGSSVQELAELASKQEVTLAAVKYGDRVFAFKNGTSTEVLA